MAFPTPQPGAQPPAPFAVAPAPRGAGWRLALLIVVSLVLVGLLSVAPLISISAARAAAYPQPSVSISVSAARPHPGDPIQFDAKSDAGRDLTYTWSFNGDSFSTDTATGASVSHSFAQYGEQRVSVTARDPIGQTASASTTIQVLPQPPHAAFTYHAYSSYFEYPVGFSADPSTGTQLTYSWSFGDGESDANRYSSEDYHYYTSAGSYTVRLTVTDVAGQSDTATQTISVK